MSNTDRDALLERWATGMETLKQYYENLYGPPGTPATLPDVTNRDGMLEAIADGMERAQKNINKRSTTYHNADTAYIKTVPAYVHEASIEKVGGQTVIWNQLQKNSVSRTNAGVVFTFNSDDGTLTISEETPGETRTGTAFWMGNNSSYYWDWHSGHKYLVSLGRDPVTNVEIYAALAHTIYFSKEKTIINGSDANNCVNCRVRKEADLSTPLVFKIQVFDLTWLYGAGNEPNTVADFEKTYPAMFYAPNPGTLLSAGVTSVVSKDSSDNVLGTFTIPDEVKSMAGYGMSCPGAYNYIDFEAKKFVQAVGSRSYEAGDESDATVITDGTNTYYALDTPVESDISAYIDSNTIEAESGGTLEFPNQHGADYKIPVPSIETFWVDIS